jgi:hypothetical protein
MKRINLEKIIETRGLNFKEVAGMLFPWNGHPVPALKRVIKGDGVLDANQISLFSQYSGIPIAELYEGHKWSSTIEGHTHILTSGEYSAHLDTKSWTTRIYKKDSIYHEFIIHSPSITLREYMERLDKEINRAK